MISFFLFLQVWPAVLLCRRTPTYYGRIVVTKLYTPAPIKKNCAVFKNVCMNQCVQRCVYMYIVRTRFYKKKLQFPPNWTSGHKWTTCNGSVIFGTFIQFFYDNIITPIQCLWYPVPLKKYTTLIFKMVHCCI